MARRYLSHSAGGGRSSWRRRSCWPARWSSAPTAASRPPGPVGRGRPPAHGGKLTLDRYEGIERWTRPRPQIAIPPAQAGSPFPFLTPSFPQTVANLNSVPDWPTVSAAVMDMWQRGGEQPVDGVLSVSTGFLGRVLTVTGPLFVPEYNETVTPANLFARLDFYTHEGGTTGVNSKDFVGAVAEVVLRKLLTAPASQWKALGTVVGQSPSPPWGHCANRRLGGYGRRARTDAVSSAALRLPAKHTKVRSPALQSFGEGRTTKNRAGLWSAGVPTYASKVVRQRSSARP